MDASEYKSVVLGLIFLKYISDCFEAKYNELVEVGDGFEEDKGEYTAENIFFVPESARWSAISAAAHMPEIGTVIDDAMRAIEKENKRLKDILGRTYEYCLSKFAEQEGKLAGEFYTPACVVRTLVEVLQPYNGRVYEDKARRWLQWEKSSPIQELDLSVWIEFLLRQKNLLIVGYGLVICFLLVNH